MTSSARHWQTSTGSTAKPGGRRRGSLPLGDKMAAAFNGFAGGGALDYQVLKRDPDAFDVNVTGCRYAEFYKKLGVPELGFLLVCGADSPMAEGYGSEVKFTRTQTIMQGASHCDFRYALKKPAGEGGADGGAESRTEG